MTQREAIEKIKRYCAYQERCQSEARQKLYTFELSSEKIENILCILIEENFIDEERFAKNFVRGKFRQKKWGKIKIKQHLKQKEISDYCIKKGFEEITREEYLKILNEILLKKSNKLMDDNVFIKKQKIAKYAINKGFENDLVWGLLRD
ncbi:MAG: RecX family transcriptional regulator [Flavobacteriales bacterium]|nr:RecX family transcriptional regulator [Flavobacteriales bacterium]|tara:strand:+ start:1902 stop:2348 length:447 start_codon:yes stop_codon:yes gene_type:complete